MSIDEFSRLPPLAGVPGATPVRIRPVITHPEVTAYRTIDGVLVNKGSIKKFVSANLMEGDAVLNGELMQTNPKLLALIELRCLPC